jgi:hypothetical protein
MHRARAVLAVVLIALGLVWIGQGLGVLRGGSFMVDDVRWAGIGGLCVVVGLALAARQLGRRP